MYVGTPFGNQAASLYERGPWALRPHLAAGLPLSQRRSVSACGNDPTNIGDGQSIGHMAIFLNVSRLGCRLYARWSFLGANIYEKALFVKPTWRLYESWPSTIAHALRAMFLSALPRSHTLFGGSVHLMRSVLIRAKGAAIFGAISALG